MITADTIQNAGSLEISQPERHLQEMRAWLNILAEGRILAWGMGLGLRLWISVRLSSDSSDSRQAALSSQFFAHNGFLKGEA